MTDLGGPFNRVRNQNIGHDILPIRHIEFSYVIWASQGALC